MGAPRSSTGGWRASRERPAGAPPPSASSGSPAFGQKVMRLTAGSLLAGLALTIAACDILEEKWPKQVSFEMRGGDGLQAKVIYATNFVAGVDDRGVTQVQVFSSDTVFHALPIDTAMSIAGDHRWLVQVEALAGDTLDVSVDVEVDGRNLLSESGGIFPDAPWRFVYVFNQRIPRAVDVRF